MGKRRGTTLIHYRQTESETSPITHLAIIKIFRQVTAQIMEEIASKTNQVLN